MVSEPTALSAAIGALYDAAIEPAKWTGALMHACAFVGGAQATLFWQGSSADEVGVFHLYNDDPFYTRLYLEELAPLNPVFPAVLFQEVGAVHTSRDLVPWPEIQKTRFHDEWIAPQGFTDALAVVLEHDAARLAVLSFPWGEGAIDAAARQRLALLVPHIQRAVAIGRLFIRQSAEAAALTETLEGVGEAAFLLRGERQVAFANAQGRAMIEDGRLLRMRGDHLCAAASEADRALGTALQAIEDRTTAGLQGTSFALTDGPDGRWTAHLVPLADGVWKHVDAVHRASAALYVRHARSAETMPLEALARSHRLTGGEIRVAEAVLRINGLDAIADALGISRATVKTHLNRVYRKCGVRNQSAFIKLVTGLGES